MVEVSLEPLFQSIKSFVIENQKQRKEKELKGEFFNIFSILNMERDEVHTHSSFIAELLNPKGSHGLKDEFLRLFIQYIPLNDIDVTTLNTKSAIVKKEEYIGKKDVIKETGGDIDILINFFSPNYTIIIENKIDAGDQEAQLARYNNYAKHLNHSFTLFYLTKDGHEPSSWSTGLKTEEHYWECISYKNEIFKWLKRCLDISNSFPLINGCIKQYQNLILKLTGQELNQTMDKNITQQMLNHNLEMLAIWENWDNWIYSIAEQVIKEVAKKTDCECKGDNETYPWWLWDNDCWVAFIPKNNPDIKIWFGKEKGDSPYYYLEKKGITTLQTKLECMEYKSSKGTPFGSKYLDSKYLRWDLCVAQAIVNGEFRDYLCNCINEVLNDPNFPK